MCRYFMKFSHIMPKMSLLDLNMQQIDFSHINFLTRVTQSVAPWWSYTDNNTSKQNIKPAKFSEPWQDLYMLSLLDFIKK